jgi:hypothetical protein
MEEITIDSATGGAQPPGEIVAKSVADGEDNESEVRPEGRLVVAQGSHNVVSASIAANFARLLPKSRLVECVAWAWEGNVLRVWTVITQRDRETQRQVYRAESQFLDVYANRLCDFSIVFRENRPMHEMLPTSARLLTFAD